MKLTYIYNSAFCIQIDGIDIIIDFYKDTKEDEGLIYNKILPSSKKLYVLCTHSHLDHYNGEILNWKNKVKGITYIFSKDILYAEMAKENAAIYLDKLETYQDAHINIKAYGSTDVGGSFYFEIGGKKIFHAGDLNNWHWNEESSEAEIAESEKNYNDELNILQSDIKQLDLAMFPVDPRLGKDFMKGAEQFIDSISVDFLAPMHFNENYDKIKQFENIAPKYNTKYWAISKKGEQINL